MDDSENNPSTQLLSSYKSSKTIKILVFGDHETGKTSFLSTYCDPQASSKSKKTIGCDLHLLKRRISYEILSKQNDQKYTQDFLFEFWELSGDKTQRTAINLYFKNQMKEFKGALFFFDCSNLKTLFNFHSWLKSLFESKTGDNSYKCLWELPFMLIGNKKDRLTKEKLNEERKKVEYYMKNIFNCKDGENVLFLKKKYQENELDIRLFELFLNHLCLEYEMKSKESTHNSEYLQEKENVVLAKATSKYTINNTYLMNKIKLNMFDKKEVANIAKSSYASIKENLLACLYILRNIFYFFCRRKEKQKQTSV